MVLKFFTYLGLGFFCVFGAVMAVLGLMEIAVRMWY